MEFLLGYPDHHLHANLNKLFKTVIFNQLRIPSRRLLDCDHTKELVKMVRVAATKNARICRGWIGGFSSPPPPPPSWHVEAVGSNASRSLTSHVNLSLGSSIAVTVFITLSRISSGLFLSLSLSLGSYAIIVIEASISTFRHHHLNENPPLERFFLGISLAISFTLDSQLIKVLMQRT